MHGTCFIGLYIGRMDIPHRLVQVCCLTIKDKLTTYKYMSNIYYSLMPQVVSEDNCYHRGEGLKTWRQNLGKLTDWFFSIVMSPEYFDVLWVC